MGAVRFAVADEDDDDDAEAKHPTSAPVIVFVLCAALALCLTGLLDDGAACGRCIAPAFQELQVSAHHQ